MFDAAISAGGLTLTLEDLSVGSQLTKFTPQFSLHGLGIDYSAGDVEISGAFLKVHVTRDGLEYDEYDGGAIIKTSELSLSALGSYAKPDNYESLFIYGVLNYPFGGPPFFFVTGLAAGFGYNRAFIVPPIEDVAKFPLIQEAVGGSGSPNDLMTELETLRDYIPATLGDIFLAVGVKFTSFKMIDSFALLAFVFGTQFEIDVLGLSTLIVPTPEEGNRSRLGRGSNGLAGHVHPGTGLPRGQCATDQRFVCLFEGLSPDRRLRVLQLVFRPARRRLCPDVGRLPPELQCPRSLSPGATARAELADR